MAEWESIAPANEQRRDLGFVGFPGPMLPNQFPPGALLNVAGFYAIGGIGPGGIISTIERFEPAYNAWSKQLKPIPQPRVGLGVVAAGTFIYAIGGLNYERRIDRYEPLTDTWVKVQDAPASLPFGWVSFGLASLIVNNEITMFAIGGAGGGGLRDHVYSYRPGAVWTKRAPMTTARQKFAVVVANNKIYCIGGQATNGIVGVVEEYDPVTDRWTTKASMPTPRYGLGAAYSAGKIFAIGGFNGSPLGTVEAFNPVTNSWDPPGTWPAMPTPRGLLGVATIKVNIFSKSDAVTIYALGGQDATGDLRACERFPKV